MNKIIVTIHWPDDPYRGLETYGPFADAPTALAWVGACQEAADLGWKLLQGADYIIDKLDEPFDPGDLMTDGSSVSSFIP
jgi:hypothetical protein